MPKRIKSVGVAVAFVIAAVAIPSSAGSPLSEIHSESDHTHLRGSQLELDNFNVEAGTLSCTESTFDGTMTQEVETEITLTPTYGKCYFSEHKEGNVATFTMNGCGYLFTLNAEAGKDNSVHIECPEGKVIEVHHPNCTVTIKPQTPKGGVSYTVKNSHGVPDIQAKITLKEMHIEHHGLCSFGGLLTTGVKGEYSSSITLQGVVGVTVE